MYLCGWHYALASMPRASSSQQLGGASCTPPKRKKRSDMLRLAIAEKALFRVAIIFLLHIGRAVRRDRIHSGHIKRLLTRRAARLAAGSGRGVGISCVRGAARLLRSVNDDMMSLIRGHVGRFA